MHKWMRLAKVVGWGLNAFRANRRTHERDGARGRRATARLPLFVLDALERRVLFSAPPLFITSANGSVGEFDSSGATINASLVTGFSDLQGVAVSGSTMFLVDRADGVIGEYTTSGAAINANLITGLNVPQNIVVSGSNLFVTLENSNTVAEFTTSGALVNPTLISGLTNIRGIAISGSNLFVVDAGTGSGDGTVGEYTTSGVTVNAALVTGLFNPSGVAVSGTDLFVGDGSTTSIGRYTTSGATVSSELITGVNNPVAIVVSGTDLFVADPLSGTVGNYTTSGVTINGNLIPTLTGPLALAFASPGTATTTAVLSSTNPAAVGSTVTLTATVSGSSGIPTGTVDFLDGATLLGTAALDATRTATLGVSSLSVGAHAITANYSGDINNLATSSVALTETVIQPKSVGILDPTFGSGGVTSHDVGFTATSGLVIQPDGKSVIAGIIGSPGTESFGATRYNADGSVDDTFGASGVAGAGFQDNDAPSAVSLRSDGSILVPGTSSATDSGSSQFAIAAFDVDGNLDPAFGSGTGKVLTSFAAGSTDIVNAVALGAGGVFYVVGSSTASGTGTDFAIAAYNADGTPDTAFNGSGRLLLDFGGGNDAANAVVVQPNGQLVVAGSTLNPSTGVTSIALARVGANGALDSRFGTNGQIVTNLRGVDDQATSVALGAKGAIVVGGVSATGSFAANTLAADFAVLQYTSVGKLDKTFNRRGSVITSFGQNSAVTTVLVQSDGEIVASGKAASSFASGANLGIAVARYTAKGTLDPTFNGGKTVITLTPSATANVQRPSAVIAPFDTVDTLRQQFEAFLGSAQGIIATTPGGNLAVAGNSDGFTEVGQLVAAGVDLAASLVAKLPASLKARAFVSITITVTEVGSTLASGSVTVQLFLSRSSSVAAGDTRIYGKPQVVKLKPRQAKKFSIRIKVPGGLSGKYVFVAQVNPNVLTDLNLSNNVAFKGPVAIS